MRMIFNAVYVAIFLGFLRRVVDKVSVPMEASITSESKKHTDEWYVLVSGSPVFWSDDRDEAFAFCYACIARERGLVRKLSVVENDDMVLVAAESLGLSEDEIDAVNATIDDFE